MLLPLGSDKKTGQSINIDIDHQTNAHGIIFGGSGAGKTYTIRALAKGFALTPGNTVIIFDVHGDILPKDKHVSTVVISEISNMGLQPLEVNPNREYGGVNRAIKRFIYSINTTTSKLGVKQEAALRKLLEDLYWRNGFYAKDPRTWDLEYDPWSQRPFPKKYPTFEDLLRFAKSKQKEIFMGANSESVKKFETFIKKSTSLNKNRAKMSDSDVEELDELKQMAIDSYTEFLYDAKDDKILDEILRYTSMDVISSIIDRLESLHSTGVFKNEPIYFDPSKPIHRYDLSSLSVGDQKVFINIAMSNLFLKLRERGFGGRTDTFVFVDEVKNYLDDHDDNMIRKFFNEVRKYGCGLWVGGQNIQHFDDDVISNSAVKLILGVDKMYSRAFARRLQIPPEKIDGIIPKKSILAEIKLNGGKGGFSEVLISK